MSAATAADWTKLLPLQWIPGYAFGFSYPVLHCPLNMPSLNAEERTNEWHGLFGEPDLQARLASLPHFTPEGPGGQDDRQATAHWLASVFDAIVELAGLPILQKVRVVRLTTQHAALAIPTFFRSRQRHTAALDHALDILAGSAGTPEMAAVIARLGKSNLTTSNTPRLVKAAVEHGIPFLELTGTDYLQFGLGSKSAIFDSTFTHYTSNLGAKLARRKHEGAAILRRNLLPAPPHRMVKDEAAALTYADEIGYPVVVKPANMDGGKGVQADLRNARELKQAIKVASEVSPMMLVEKFVPGRDYRLTVFRGRFVWAVERRPGGVTGDGVSTVQQLVNAMNADPARGDGPTSALKRLKIDKEAKDLLKRDGLALDSVPGEGEFVRLRRTSNITNGGTPIAVTERVHPDNAALAVRAARALKLDIAGIDLIIPDIAVSWKENGGSICEVNAQPELGGTTGNHLYPQLLKTILGGNGRVPVISIVGGDESERTARAIADKLASAGIRVGLHTNSGVELGRNSVMEGPVSELQAGQYFAIDPAVDAMIFAACDSRVLGNGFPIPYIDLLLLSGQDVPIAPSTPNLAPETAAVEMLRVLLPATRKIALVGDTAGLSPSIRKALEIFNLTPESLDPGQIAGMFASGQA